MKRERPGFALRPFSCCMWSMENLEAVLFDCDGVLVDSETLVSGTLSDELGQYGLNIPVNEVGRLFIGGTMAGVMQSAREMGADLPEDWLDHIYGRVFAVLSEQCAIIPGVAEVLDRLEAAGVPYATCSNGPMAKMEVTLTRCGLWDRFEGRIFTAHACARSKPFPDVYLKAAEALGAAPANCAVVEDSATGARAGVAAGMPVFGYVAATDPARLAPHCVAMFEHMAGFPSLAGLIAND